MSRRRIFEASPPSHAPEKTNEEGSAAWSSIDSDFLEDEAKRSTQSWRDWNETPLGIAYGSQLEPPGPGQESTLSPSRLRELYKSVYGQVEDDVKAIMQRKPNKEVKNNVFKILLRLKLWVHNTYDDEVDLLALANQCGEWQYIGDIITDNLKDIARSSHGMSRGTLPPNESIETMKLSMEILTEAGVRLQDFAEWTVGNDDLKRQIMDIVAELENAENDAIRLKHDDADSEAKTGSEDTSEKGKGVGGRRPEVADENRQSWPGQTVEDPANQLPDDFRSPYHLRQTADISQTLPRLTSPRIQFAYRALGAQSSSKQARPSTPPYISITDSAHNMSPGPTSTSNLPVNPPSLFSGSDLTTDSYTSRTTSSSVPGGYMLPLTQAIDSPRFSHQTIFEDEHEEIRLAPGDGDEEFDSWAADESKPKDQEPRS